MKRTSFFLVLLILVAAGSVYLAFARTPERIRVKSETGRVIVEGRARASQPLEINDYPIEPVANLIGDAYEILPSDTVLDTPVTIYYDVRDIEDQDSLTLYRVADPFEMWSALDVTIDKGIVSYTTNQLGWFALGRKMDVQTPSFGSTLDDLMTYAPEETVGYTIALGFRSEDMHDTLLNPAYFVGGCGSVFQKGETVEFSRIEQPMDVFVNGVQTPVMFVFIAAWQVGDGCYADQVLGQITQM